MPVKDIPQTSRARMDARGGSFQPSYLLSRHCVGGLAGEDMKKGPPPCAHVIAAFLSPHRQGARARSFLFACQKGVFAPKRVVFEPRKEG
jgi:hypothetical protein